MLKHVGANMLHWAFQVHSITGSKFATITKMTINDEILPHFIMH